MATISFETTMTIDNEEQMKSVLEAYEDAEIRGSNVKYTPEEIESRLSSDLEHLKRLLTQ